MKNTIIINRLAAEAVRNINARIAASEVKKSAAVEAAAQSLEASVSDKDSPAYPLVAAAAACIRAQLGTPAQDRLPYQSLDFGIGIAVSAGRAGEVEYLTRACNYSHYWPGCGCNMDKDPLKNNKETIVAAEAEIAAAKSELKRAESAIR